MGFFDICCAVSGLPLCAQDAAAWLVHEDDRTPITIPVRGTYDRLGGIEAKIWLKPQPDLDSLHRIYFDWLESGRLLIKGVRGSGAEDQLRTDHPVPDYQHGITLLFRALAEAQASPRPIWFDGRRVSMVLVNDAFMTAAARHVAATVPDLDLELTALSSEALLKRAFGAASVDHERVPSHGLREPLLELIRVTHYLAEHPPVSRIEQLTDDEVLARIEELVRAEPAPPLWIRAAHANVYASIANRRPDWAEVDTRPFTTSRLAALLSLGRTDGLSEAVASAADSDQAAALRWAILFDDGEESLRAIARGASGSVVVNVLEETRGAKDAAIQSRRDRVSKLRADYLETVAPPPPKPQFTVGGQVTHGKFGAGTIVAVTPGKPDKLTIDFESGRKVLAATFVQAKS